MPMNSKLTRGRRALVTGATGFVGSHLARRLVQNGYEVHLIARATSNTWRITDILAKVSIHAVDLLEREKLAETVGSIQPDIIFHLANAGVYGGKHLPERDLIAVNFIGTHNLLNACEAVGYTCFVNTGSSAEYGPKGNPMSESDACDPVTMYGLTKLASTLCGRFEALAKNKPVVTLRLFSPYGPYDDPLRLMSYALVHAIKNVDLDLADPKAVRDYVYVGDVVEAYMNCIDRAARHPGEIINIGSGSQTPISTAIEQIMALTGSTSAIRWNAVSPRSFDARRWEADIRKAGALLDWRPRYSLEEGLRESIAWFRENITLYNQ